MYGAAEGLAEPVRELVIANWTWVLSSAHGGRVTAPFFASRAYPDDGYAAAHATMTLTQLWDRIPDVRQALAAAWAATRTPADWCRAAELQARYGGEVPIFTYPRGPVPPKSATRPWISRLLGCE
jgi:alkylhydroperoxidase family enzyme